MSEGCEVPQKRTRPIGTPLGLWKSEIKIFVSFPFVWAHFSPTATESLRYKFLLGCLEQTT